MNNKLLKYIFSIIISCLFIALINIVSPIQVHAESIEGWVSDNNGWWYRNADGSYPANAWRYINGAWYYFDGSGYIYENSWQYINGAWYYFYSGGAMASNCWIGDYYVDASGRMNSGTWIHNETGWWYRNADGSYPANAWKYINGAWYYFDGSGYIYENSWQYINGAWYYFYSGGARASNCWIGSYYVNGSGQWVQETWVHDETGWRYRNGDGSYPANAWKYINGAWYYFDGSGYIYENSWQYINGAWYYFYSGGAMASDCWIGTYYVAPSGAWVPGEQNTEGIDISAFNGDIDLTSYKNNFVMIRAGYGWTSDPASATAYTFPQTDKQFINNVQKCEALGIPYGFYWFSYATNVDEARLEAQTFLNVTSGYHPVMGYWCDQESDSNSWKVNHGWSWDKANDITNAFTDVLTGAGKNAGVYASYNPFKQYLNTSLPKWVAHYGNGSNGRDIDVSDAGNVKIHQYSGSGIDRDILLVPMNAIFQ